MKTHLKLLTGVALLLSACTTGTMVSSRGYTDDVYYTPGDTPPPVATNSPRKGQNNEPAVSARNSQERAARVVDEYFDNNQNRSNTYSYNNDNSAAADTLYDENEEEDMNIDDQDLELSYSTRLRTFYNPYMYDPFWDSYMGWGYGFGGMYGGWYSPWSYRGWYDPYYSYAWGYPYYGGYGFYGGYYGSYWDGYYGGGYYGGGHWNGGHGRDRYFGRQNLAGNYGRQSNAVSYGSNASMRSAAVSGSNYNNAAFSGRRGATATAPNYSSRQAGTRYSVDPNLSTRSARVAQPQQGGNNETLMNLRRSGTRQGYTSPSTRSSSISQDNSQRYTPTYSRPRTNTQATYNSGARDYGRQQQYRSSESSSRYAKPGSYSAAPSRSSYSSGESGATYQRRSATYSEGNSYSGRTYSSPSYSAPSRSSSESYSAPRSSSSGSFSGGGSYSGGGGGGGSFSGGGGGDGGGRRR